MFRQRSYILGNRFRVFMFLDDLRNVLGSAAQTEGTRGEERL
jgi:hypothetical protein